MRISKRCQYALRAVFELATRDSGQPAKIHEIADAQGIPPRFLEVILNQLRLAGIVESRRGSEGGYMLSISPKNLTIGKVVQQIEGPVLITSNGDEPEKREKTFYGDFAFKQLWQNVSNAVSDVYNNTTFAMLIDYQRVYRNTVILNYSI